MQWLLVLIVLLPLGAAAFLVALKRFVRCRRRPVEVPMREENAILPQEWALVRRAQCQRTRCPRAIGSPLRPRKDAHREICAAMLLERQWKQMLGNASVSCDARRPLPADRETGWALSELIPPAAVARAARLADRPHADQPRGHNVHASGRWLGRGMMIGGVPAILAGGTLAGTSPWAGPSWVAGGPRGLPGAGRARASPCA